MVVVRDHLERKDDGLVTVRPVLDRVPDFGALIAGQSEDASFAALRAAEQTGRPLATADSLSDWNAFFAGASPAARLAECFVPGAVVRDLLLQAAGRRDVCL